MTTPKPTRFANYPGDVTYMIGEVKTNRNGEVLTVVVTSYDKATNKTRVGFTFQRVGLAALAKD